ncbi:MAG: hypothetical protein RLZZ15_353 [Verrucomicrobiota bacterium]|jgi:hypothetical protein
MKPHAHRLLVLAGELAVVRLPAEATVPSWVRGAFTSITRTAGELSIVCSAGCVPAGLRAESGWVALRVAGALEFSATGVLASLAAPLAEARIPLLAIATFDTDYLLVRRESLAAATTALMAAGHAVDAAPPLP